MIRKEEYEHPRQRYRITTCVELEDFHDLSYALHQEPTPEGLKEFTATFGNVDRVAVKFTGYAEDMRDAVTDPFAVLEWLGDGVIQMRWYSIEDTERENGNETVAEYVTKDAEDKERVWNEGTSSSGPERSKSSTWKAGKK